MPCSLVVLFYSWQDGIEVNALISDYWNLLNDQCLYGSITGKEDSQIFQILCQISYSRNP